MEALVKQKIGRVAQTGRKMFDVNIVINDPEMGSISIHTNWRDMPYPMYKNKIKKLQKLVDFMIEHDWDIKMISQFFNAYYLENWDITQTVIEVSKHWDVEKCLSLSLLTDYMYQKS